MSSLRSRPTQQVIPALRIWDLPTRLFHWLLAISITGALITINLGGAWMDWHVRFGIASFVLLLFRVIWGLIGPRYARFSQFLCSPAKTLAYLRDSKGTRHAGHNPLGAWSVIAMLSLFLFQSSTGLFANDDVMTQGPLAQFVSNDTVALFTRLHRLSEYVLYALIVLHLGAIAFYSFRGEGLVKPMVTGDVPKHTLTAGTHSARDDWRVRLGACILAALLTVLAWWLINLAFNAPASFT
ncbi:MAG: cytochrome b/b6 domain-containing protein [Burkholderiaceae bacterium]|nr:cytochrome b/b6 domain-containing protein [Burkholderiaceae bacterium]